MLRLILATAVVSAGFSLSAPSPAMAGGSLEGLCNFAGGTMVEGVCHLQDGRTVTCPDDEDAECVVTAAPITLRPLSKFNVPKLLKKKPAPREPVEIEMGTKIEMGGKFKQIAPSRRLTDAIQAPTELSVTRHDTPALKSDGPAERSVTVLDAPVERSMTVPDAPVMNMETITVVPTIEFKPFN